MAFQSAPGYTNLPNGVFSPVIYSQKVQKTFRKKAVANDVTNSDYFGEIANYGDSVQIIKEPEIAITTYARGKVMTSETVEDEDFTLIVDRANAFQFQIDDIEKKQSHVNWMDLATDRAAYNLADRYDQDILGYLAGYEKNASGVWVARTAPVGTKARDEADVDELLPSNKLDAAAFGGASGSALELAPEKGTGVVTALQLLSRFARILDEADVPTEGRWVIVDPVFEEILRDEDSKFMNEFYQKGEQLSNGRVSSNTVRGFRVYKSNNLPKIGDGASGTDATTDGGFIIAGHDGAAATAEQINKTEHFRSQNTFADVVRGLHMYGRKILRPESLLRAKYISA